MNLNILTALYEENHIKALKLTETDEETAVSQDLIQAFSKKIGNLLILNTNNLALKEEAEKLYSTWKVCTFGEYYLLSACPFELKFFEEIASVRFTNSGEIVFSVDCQWYKNQIEMVLAAFNYKGEVIMSFYEKDEVNVKVILNFDGKNIT